MSKIEPVTEKEEEYVSEWDRRRYVPKAGEPELPPNYQNSLTRPQTRLLRN